MDNQETCAKEIPPKPRGNAGKRLSAAIDVGKNKGARWRSRSRYYAGCLKKPDDRPYWNKEENHRIIPGVNGGLATPVASTGSLLPAATLIFR